MTYIPAILRKEVIDRAKSCCGYCLMSLLFSVVLVTIFSLSITLAQSETNTPCISENIVFVSERTLALDIYLMNINDLVPQLLLSTGGGNYAPQFSPDGEHMVFVSNQSDVFSGQDLYLLDINRGDITQLTSTAETQELYPTWSPDGRYITYSSDEDGDFELYMMEMGNRENIIQLTNNTVADIQASWSPDGNYIAYSSDGDGDFEINLLEVATPENIIQLTDNIVLDVGVTWSPAGDKIAYATGDSQNLDIVMMDIFSLEILEIVVAPTIETQPAWSLDGQSMAFSSNRDGDYDVYIVDLEANDIRQLTNDSHFDGNPVWQPTNCDEKLLTPEATRETGS